MHSVFLQISRWGFKAIRLLRPRSSSPAASGRRTGPCKHLGGQGVAQDPNVHRWSTDLETGPLEHLASQEVAPDPGCPHGPVCRQRASQTEGCRTWSPVLSAGVQLFWQPIPRNDARRGRQRATPAPGVSPLSPLLSSLSPPPAWLERSRRNKPVAQRGSPKERFPPRAVRPENPRRQKS